MRIEITNELKHKLFLFAGGLSDQNDTPDVEDVMAILLKRLKKEINEITF